MADELPVPDDPDVVDEAGVRLPESVTDAALTVPPEPLTPLMTTVSPGRMADREADSVLVIFVADDSLTFTVFPGALGDVDRLAVDARDGSEGRGPARGAGKAAAPVAPVAPVAPPPNSAASPARVPVPRPVRAAAPVPAVPPVPVPSVDNPVLGPASCPFSTRTPA